MTRQLAASPGPLSGTVASPPREVSAQTESMLHALTWLFRGGGAVLIGVATFGYSAASGRDLVIEAVAFAIGAVVVAYWLVADLRPEHRQPRVLAGALIAMAAASGFASMGAHGGPLIGFAFMAAIGAGAGSSLLTGCVTTAIALVGVEAGALVTGASATSALGFPLLLIVAFVSGRNRAAYRRQAEQSAALVTQMEQLRAEQRRAAVLDERTRIAREIHDVLAHSLGALGIQLQAVHALMAEQGDTGRALSLLDQAQRMAKDGLAETRRAVHALRADTAGLDEELAALADTHRSRHHARVSFGVGGQPRPLPPEATVALIRTAQEALVNTAKHAPAQPVDIGLHYGAGRSPDDHQQPAAVRQPDSPGPGTAFGTVNGGYGLTGHARAAAADRRLPHRGIRRRPLDRDGAGAPMSYPAEAPLRVIIADDQASVREGLVLLLGLVPGIEVTAAAADGQQALDLVAEHHPDAILLDLHMPVLDGIQATRRLTAEHPEVAIVILTTYADDTSVLAALRAGARSYLTKDADRADIARALHSAAGGLSVMDPAVQATLVAAAGSRQHAAPG